MSQFWKPIAGTNEKYWISSYGRVYSYKSNRNLTLQKTEKGYVMACIFTDKFKMKAVARLVGMAFIDNPHNLPEINHLDGDKNNNRVSNLVWSTTRDNLLHAFKLGLKVNKGAKNPTSKLTDKKVLRIREAYKVNPKLPLKFLAQKFNVTVQLISMVKHRKCWQHI